jgi:tRNA A37 threonylcarbamoyltransferase TsaD
MQRACKDASMTLYLPRMGLCVDNAAMVALAGYLHHRRGDISELDLNPRANAPL